MHSQAMNAIVVGMPRSGTSMTSAIFAREGYFVAADPESELREGDEHNPGGYWEAESVIESNVRLFRAIGYEAHNTWLFDAIPDGAERSLADVVAPPENVDVLRTYERHRPWLWKDPRLCYTLGHWWPLLDPERTRVLFLRREPEAILRSFVRLGWRDGSDGATADVLRRIEDHLDAARWAIEHHDIPCLELDYEDFQARPAQVAERLAETFGFQVAGDDLGFAKTLNHSSWHGRLLDGVQKAQRALPAPVRRALKRAVPKGIRAALRPRRR